MLHTVYLEPAESWKSLNEVVFQKVKPIVIHAVIPF
jgi:hypothetical protein